jgi:hypothetical protein
MSSLRQPILYLQFALLMLIGFSTAYILFRIYATKAIPSTRLVQVFSLCIAVVGAGLGGGAWFASFYPPIFSIISTGLIIFSYFVLLSMENNGALEDRDVRVAITCSVTVVYIGLVGFGVFVRIPIDEQESPMAQSLLISFTSVVGIVLAFYFGTSAYLEGKKLSEQELKKQ